jgi:predicted dehydrogenase/SAM-dependent methyltransferase
MDALGYGPVADYFEHRLSDPTYLSGLALLSSFGAAPVFELACGIGLLLRAAGADGLGGDVVFSKLWLARRFVVPDAELVCFDAAAPFPLPDGRAATAFCHDALYFLPRKDHVAAELRRIAPVVLVGHTHNALADNLSAGDPLDPDGYAALLPGATLYVDEELTAAHLEDRAPRPAAAGLHETPAIALVHGAGEPRRAGTADPGPLRRNPLLDAGGTVRWPSARYEAEYAALSGHLTAPLPRSLTDWRRRRLLVPALERDTVRFGIAGAGWVARDHVVGAMHAAAGVEPLATYDPHATITGLPAADTLEELLEHVDAVYVATPNDVHAEVVEAAARAERAVLCEKPMAATLAQAERMAQAVRESGIHYATAFDQRHHPAHEALRALIAQGRLGTVTAVRIVYACWVGPDWATDNWRADPARAGGGALMDLAPHGLDLTSHLLGEPLETVQALRQHRVHDYAVEDGAVLVARTRDGVLATLHVAYNHPEHLPRRRLEVVGTRGLAVATDTMGQDPGGSLTVDGEAVGFDATTSPFTRMLEAFAARTGPGLDHDLHLMRLLEPCR